MFWSDECVIWCTFRIIFELADYFFIIFFIFHCSFQFLLNIEVHTNFSNDVSKTKNNKALHTPQVASISLMTILLSIIFWWKNETIIMRLLQWLLENARTTATYKIIRTAGDYWLRPIHDQRESHMSEELVRVDNGNMNVLPCADRARIRAYNYVNGNRSAPRAQPPYIHQSHKHLIFIWLCDLPRCFAKFTASKGLIIHQRNV